MTHHFGTPNLKHPFSIFLYGPAGSGKTLEIKDIIREHNFDHILAVDIHEGEYSDIPKCEKYQHVSDKDIWEFIKEDGDKLLIFDECKVRNSTLLELLNIYRHHSFSIICTGKMFHALHPNARNNFKYRIRKCRD